MFKKFNITCDEATTICDKSQYKEASFTEILKLKWHFLQCKVCKLYSIHNKKMSLFFRVIAADCKKNKKKLSEADKEKLAVEFKKIRV
ncbi:hypothetical protein [Polaribacter sp. Hel_I_88]|uniref:hypothetical protein n=1 Tax=Polaribacter sp. Hel_I_88 TaxID=1250006 RepID=UPI000479784E|nr:hypothetical protein [Polaribacter sp. Hel_I_88]